MSIRPPLPPFTRESATQKVRLAEDGWNTRDAAKKFLELAASLGESQTPRNTSFAGKAKRFWADILGETAQ